MDLIKVGSASGDVVVAQEQLGIVADGDFGPKTKAAVEAFQKLHGLTVDGVVGFDTWVKLLPKCIDVSDFANNSAIVNWTGFDVLIIKATEGATFKNPQLGYWLSQARAHGKMVGFYLYVDCRYTAQQHIDNLEAAGIDWSAADTLPLFVDYEDQPDDSIVTDNLAGAVALIRDICSLGAVLTGGTPIIYTYKGFWRDTLGDPDLSAYGLWDANVSTENMAPFGGWTRPLFWQYAQRGSDTDPFNGTGDKDWSMFCGGMSGLRGMLLHG